MPDADQRGIGRPIGTGCDIGAVERVVSVATTGVATGIGETFATLAGSVDNPGPLGSARFQYGTTTAYRSESASFPIPANTVWPWPWPRSSPRSRPGRPTTSG